MLPTSAQNDVMKQGPASGLDPDRLARLAELEKKVLWLAVWTIHNANNLRPKRDGLKVGGHQASCASMVTLMTALYFDVLRPQDRVAVKPHASPVFHAIQHLFGRQSRENLMRFRAFGGAQSYPSRTKDVDDVDFSTGSVGLGIAVTAFSSLIQDYVRLKDMQPEGFEEGRMIALCGDAELDEGNVYECLLEGWKHDLRNVWWVVDYNRQSLDAVVEDRLSQRLDVLFESMGWQVETLKYGRRLEAAFEQRGGEALRNWIDYTPNSLYSSLVYRGGADWRERILGDIGDASGVRELLDGYDDDGLASLMTNLGGHDMATVLDAFHEAEKHDRPTCFLAYTIKGYGLPFAGHKDNHAGLMNPEQMGVLQNSMNIREGHEWDLDEGIDFSADGLREFLETVPFGAETERRHRAPLVQVPEAFEVPRAESMSTQEGFGRVLADIARVHPDLADHVVTTSPDVTVSTNLGAWVNRRGLFDRRRRADLFKEESIASAQTWSASPEGQHIELGIAENNLFLMLAAAGLSHSILGTRLLPIGTLYDPFISRGLDALNYACYQDARFLLVATPSGVSLAPEGGAHQSIYTPQIGMGQPGLASFEPSYVDELAIIMRWAFEHMQADDGGSVYLRLSTRQLAQPERTISPALAAEIREGAYWLQAPGPDASLVLVSCGTMTEQAVQAYSALREDDPDVGHLVVTSPDRLHAGWLAASEQRMQGDSGALSHAESLLYQAPPSAGLVTIVDAHPTALSWLGSVARHATVPLGVERFGQSGDSIDLYREYKLDADAIVDAAARVLLSRSTGA